MRNAARNALRQHAPGHRRQRGTRTLLCLSWTAIVFSGAPASAASAGLAPSDSGAATPTATATSSPPAATEAPLPTGTPAPASLDLGTATGSPGDTVAVTATLHTAGAAVVITENEITFDTLNVPIVSQPGLKPDCTVTPALLRQRIQGLFLFRPLGCDGTDCTMVLAFIFPEISGSRTTIPDGSDLYTCNVAISPDAVPGEYSLAVSGIVLKDPNGVPLPATGHGGTVVVVPRVPTPTPTTLTPSVAPSPTGTPPPCDGDCSGDGQVTIDELLRCVAFALSADPHAGCSACDANKDGTVQIEEIISGIDNALLGCPHI